MVLKLYLHEASAPARAVWMLIKELNIHDVEYIKIDVVNGENKKPDYTKINPLHQVPTIDDDGFILWESRAILRYLVNNSNNKTIYPAEPKTRAKIDRLLDFDSSGMFRAMHTWHVPMIYSKTKEDANFVSDLHKQFATLNDVYMTDGMKYLVGDNLTLADLSILPSIVLTEVWGFSYSKYTRVKAWVDGLRMSLPYFDECHRTVYEWKRDHMELRKDM